MVTKLPIITLLTDFGTDDTFVSQMKGVILNINPEVNIIDITHSIDPYNIRHGAVMLGTSYSYFPAGTIHVAVVDPGVGSERRPIIVKTKKHFFIGPDNGIFSFIYNENKTSLQVYHITKSKYFLKRTGPTFHGRNIFAPVSAWLSKGMPAKEFGKKIINFTSFDIKDPEIGPDNIIEGEILYIDHFGNCITNITAANFLLNGFNEENLDIKFKRKNIHIKKYYSEAKNSKLYAIINSSAYLELFINKGNASKRFNINIGDKIIVTIKS